MSDILCVYYSRTGRTEKAMGEIAQALDAELVKIEDGQDRSKLRGYLRSGLEAMSKKLCPIAPVQTERPLQEYRLVIIGPHGHLPKAYASDGCVSAAGRCGLRVLAG